MSRTLIDQDVAAMLRIAAEVAETGGDEQARRANILQRLMALIGACGAACSECDTAPDRDSGWVSPDSITLAGLPESHAQATRSYLIGRLGAIDPCTPHLLRRKESTVTLRRADVVDRSWFRSEHFNVLRRPRGLGESLYGAFSTPDGRRLKVTFLRELNDPDFSERDVQVLQIFNENLARLYVGPPRASACLEQPSRVDAAMSSLPPRLRPVLRQLLVGDSEKQVAFKLHLSPNTVHEYTKTLYRAFEVNSRGELLAQFVVNA